MASPASDLRQLPTDQKLRLLAELWDSIEESADIALTEEQWAEIRRRMARTDANPAELVSYEEMRRRLGWQS